MRRGVSRSPATKTTSTDPSEMPRPCAVESHARHYKKPPLIFPRCHGLAPWSLTLAATKTNPHKNLSDATALRRGVSQSPLQKQPPQKSLRCHGLAPWSLTLATTNTPPTKISQMPRPCAVESHARRYKNNPCKNLSDATASRRGVSCSPLQKQPPQKISQMPRPCAVESHARRYKNKPPAKISQMPPHARRYKNKPRKNFPDATAHARHYKNKPSQKSLRCHGTLAAIKAFWNHRLCDCKLSLTKTAPLLDVLTNLRASQITVAANIDTRLPEAFYPRRNERSTNLFLRRVH